MINNLPSEEILGDLQGTFDAVDGEAVRVKIASDTKLTGHVALVVEPSYGYIAVDIDAVSDHTFYADPTDWDLITAYEKQGAWLMRLNVNLGSSSVEEIVAQTSELYQNYPNPFNPSTTIKFINNMSGNVKLSVFNVKGELVSTLVNEYMDASKHTVNFNASNLNSGVYYYTLQTPNKTITKKMILIK
jgi:hypothetical protein